MAKQNTAVAKKPTSAVSTEMPDWMKGDAGKGSENIDRSDLEQPRLKLVQSTSKELDAYNDLRPGQYFHTAQEEIFKGPLKVVPVYYERRFLLWRPLDDGGGVLARSDDGIHLSPSNASFTVKLDKKDGGGQVTWKTAETVEKSGLAEWGTSNPDDESSPPALTMMYCYLFAFPDFPDILPAVFTFQRAAIKAGKRFNTRLKTNRVPMFGLVFELTSAKAANAAGKEFYVPVLTGQGTVQDEAAYNDYKAINTSLSQSGMNIKDEESLQTEAVTDTDEPEDKPSTTGRAKPKY